MTSFRGAEWQEFSKRVLSHVEGYTVPQYGDYPNDQASKWTIEDCLNNIQKYMNRYGKNARDGQQELDFVKMAHYICLAWKKYQESLEDAPKVKPFEIRMEFDFDTAETVTEEFAKKVAGKFLQMDDQFIMDNKFEFVFRIKEEK